MEMKFRGRKMDVYSTFRANISTTNVILDYLGPLFLFTVRVALNLKRKEGVNTR